MSEDCEKMHAWLNALPRLKFPFEKERIPLNGIYVLFEKGEYAHGKDRIVRVGTHTGKDQLRSRLFQHFVNENKDRSIFRKNIGRALLKKANDSFLKQWEWDLTTKTSRAVHAGNIDLKKQKEIEGKVSEYIQEQFSFVVFEVKDKSKRLELESKMISTISSCEDCKSSKTWLGGFSPKEKIRKSGLWLVNELWKAPLSKKEMQELKKILGV